MKDNIEASRFLLTIFAYLLPALIVLQGFREWIFQRSQRTREDTLEARRASREDTLEKARWDNEDRLRDVWSHRDERIERHRVAREQRIDSLAQQSTRSISSILTVLHRTLEARRVAEDQARKTAMTSEQTVKELRDEIRKLTTEIVGLKRVGAEVQRTQDNEKASIEKTAGRLSLLPRHQFRHKLRSFEQFAQQYEGFRSRYGSDDGDPFLGFSPVVSYVRGTAAHYFNDPTNATLHFEKIVSTPLDKRDDGDRKRRIIVLYLLGLTESNFESYEAADSCFKNSLDLETKPAEGEKLISAPPDLLTRVVAAEAAAMAGSAILANK
jgi:hypothetical protein